MLLQTFFLLQNEKMNNSTCVTENNYHYSLKNSINISSCLFMINNFAHFWLRHFCTLLKVVNLSKILFTCHIHTHMCWASEKSNIADFILLKWKIILNYCFPQRTNFLFHGQRIHISNILFLSFKIFLRLTN